MSERRIDTADGGAVEVAENVPLAPMTTLGVGGPARYFARVASAAGAAAAIAWARAEALPLLVLGGGSNLLVSDAGFGGLVLKMEIEGRRMAAEGRGDEALLDVGAGEDWDALVEYAVATDLAGLECLSGIPGRAGASPIQNIGAYGQEVRETVDRVTAVDVATGALAEFANADCGFGYRESRFKFADAGRYVVVGVRYRLARGGAPAVRYAELERKLAEQEIGAPTLADVRRTVLAIRRAKSMVLDEADPDARSAGSFFVNPVVPAGQFAALEEAERTSLPEGKRVPSFAAGEGRVKVPAGWLIENAGFAKGYSRGRAGLSSKHALAIVNRGGATAGEIAALAREVRDRVRDRFGITLAPEPVFVGLSLDEPSGD